MLSVMSFTPVDENTSAHQLFSDTRRQSQAEISARSSQKIRVSIFAADCRFGLLLAEITARRIFDFAFCNGGKKEIEIDKKILKRPSSEEKSLNLPAPTKSDDQVV